LFIQLPYCKTCGVVSLFIFLEKTKQKIVVALESLRFQGRSPQQGTRCVINENVGLALADQ